MVLSERDSKGGNTHTLEDSPIRGDRRGEGGGEERNAIQQQQCMPTMNE